MSTIVSEVARKLGAPAETGAEIRSQADLAGVVRHRLPLAILQRLPRFGLSEQEIETFIIPQRTRRHRAAKNQPLTVEESDALVRLLRIQTLAEEAFADREKANLWLRRPLHELGSEAPIVVARTEAGSRVVEAILGRIAWGAAA